MPCAAYSHSSSLGKRLPTHSQYVFAWAQDTHATGWLPGIENCEAQLWCAIHRQARALTHARYWLTVTSVRSIQNDPTATRRLGRRGSAQNEQVGGP